MLYVFDMDMTLIEGYLEQERCEACRGEGRVPAETAPVGLEGDYPTWDKPRPMTLEKCARCKGKGFRFTGHLPYEVVTVLPNRLEKLAEVAEWPGVRFGIATNQGGVAMGYQTEDEVFEKMGRAIGALRCFYGRPLTLHVAFHHPKATVPGYDDPALCELRKPLPGMLHAAMAAHNVPPWHTTFVGDLATDRDCAEAAGVKFEWAYDFFERGR